MRNVWKITKWHRKLQVSLWWPNMIYFFLAYGQLLLKRVIQTTYLSFECALGAYIMLCNEVKYELHFKVLWFTCFLIMCILYFFLSFLSFEHLRLGFEKIFLFIDRTFLIPSLIKVYSTLSNMVSFSKVSISIFCLEVRACKW